jgi:sialic acid synthase SpsE/sugar phosphate isomerase/epimerase/CBS domain-containing protein
MLIDRQVKHLTILSEESVIGGLQKMCQNGNREILLISEEGVLEGVFTDGDLRHWLSHQKNADLNKPIIEAANRNFVAARATYSASKIAEMFTDRIRFIPLLDAQGRLVAVARKDEVHFQIGDFTIDGTGPAFVIAEIGNNHNGDIELAKRLVDSAIAAGADCVKFQIRHMNALYRNVGKVNADNEDLGAQYVLDLLSKFQLADDELFEVFDYCQEQGILPICTPWDLSSLAALERYGMIAYKVASADLTNHELLESLARTGKPLIVSTGMSEESEITEAHHLLCSLGAPIVLLHCNSTYPAPFHDLNLRYIERLKEINNGLVGYSGHERGYSAVLAAIALGARVIEKHLTLDRNMEGNDHKVSLLPDEFAHMVQAIREVEQSMGMGGERKLSQGEMMNRSTLAKSLVVTKRLEIGELITDDIVIARSPGQGLQPNRRNELIGRRAKRCLEAGDFFYPSDLIDDSASARKYEFSRPWGVPVRYHDYKNILSKTNPNLLEFHLSYKDLDVDFTKYLGEVYPDITLAVHSPELFSGDHIMDLCSFDEKYRQRSIFELQRVIDLTLQLKQYFPTTERPVIVTNVGGFSLDRPLDGKQISAKKVKLADSLNCLNRDGVEIIPQTMPPYPWHMGGQRFHNLFVDAENTVDICKELNLRICFDVSHSKLACNQLRYSFKEFVSMVGPLTAHLHIADAEGVDGEGIQIGDGDLDLVALAEGLEETCPKASFIPEIWQGHTNEGEGFWIALSRLEKTWSSSSIKALSESAKN